jgi:hypothetical protein
MPGDIVIKDYQIEEAERFLEALLATNIPQGNFQPGSHLHDIVVRSFAYVIAYIRAEVDEVSALQSLQRLQNMSGYSVDAAVDNLVSNWFVTRRDGTKSRGVIRLYFYADVDMAIVPATATFTYSDGMDFVPVSDSDIVLYKGGNLVPKYSDSGELTGYCADIPVEAQFSGVSGAIPPRAWSSWDDISPYLYRVDSQYIFSESTSIESSAELIERAKESVTSRDFLSRRSLNAAILEDVPSVSSVYAVGAGDPEMMRDRVLGFGDSEVVHALGHVNVYARTDTVPEQMYAEVLEAGQSEVSLPTGTRVSRVTSVRVHRLSDVLEDTDYEAAEPVRVSHVFDSTTGSYTYYLGDTHLTRDAAGIGTAIQANQVTNRAVSTVSTDVFSTAVYDGNMVASSGTYRVSVADPSHFNTKNSQVVFDVGTTTYPRRVVVTYGSYAAPDLLDTYLEDRDRRVLASNLMAYCPTAVIVRLGIKYLKKSTASGVPDDLIKTGVSNYVTTYDLERPLRASDIVSYIMNTFSAYVSSVSFPIGISYTLESPNGRLVEFYSEDAVSISDENLVSGAITSVAELLQLQVSDNTIQLVCEPSDITVSEVQ